jgi:hypothetical protein
MDWLTTKSGYTKTTEGTTSELRKLPIEMQRTAQPEGNSNFFADAAVDLLE